MTTVINASRTGEAAKLMIDKNHNRGLRGLRLFLGVMAATIVFGAGDAVSAYAQSAYAQDGTVVIGGSGAPDVQVDLNAITGGGPAMPYSPTGRRLLMPNAGKMHGIKLRPPGSSSGVKHVAAKAKPAASEAAATQATGEPTSEEPLIPPPPVESTPPAPPPSASAPTPLSKSAEEPPPPPAQKTLPVESTPLAPAANAAKAEAPPPPPAAKSTAPAKAGTEKTAEAAPETPPPPPPPAPSKAESVPPPPAPAAASKTESAAPPPPPPVPVTPAPATSAETAPPPAPNPQVAALPPAPSFSMEKPTAIPFVVGASTLADPAKQTLGSVAQTLNGNADLRLQIVAYATGSDDNASQARRLSLSRALAVRSFLIDAGIRSTRMDVRALGNKFDSGPGDRVDLIVVKP